MKKLAVCAFVLLFITSSGIFAADFKVTGVYNAWGQSQHAFLFDDASYDHNYIVQMLRFNLQAVANDNLKMVTRLDLAQGWWGMDNELRSVDRTGSTGASSQFDFKDTNFLVHVDQAYIDFKIPKRPIGIRLGRMWYGLGNKLMVDNNYEGIQIDLNNVIGNKLTFGWARVFEGADDLSDDESIAAADIRGNTDARDANLLTLNFNNNVGSFTYDAYGLFYQDLSVLDNNAFIPDNLQFFKTRFSPQITQLTALGLAFAYKSGKLSLNGEFDYLMGKDDIRNIVHGANQMWDINDGNLSGFNLYLKGDFTASPKFALGVVLGMGSGDDDLTGGKGNVNKLRTSGFFYITEIWEDSIMPDEEGITPEGLGAPNVRGYRELENSTIVQANMTLTPWKDFSAFASYNLIRATQPIHAWHSNGRGDWIIDPNTSASDIGQEIDFRLSYNLYKELSFGLRGGYFMPGTAAGYLIRGNNKFDDPAWELKSEVQFTF